MENIEKIKLKGKEYGVGSGKSDVSSKAKLVASGYMESPDGEVYNPIYQFENNKMYLVYIGMYSTIFVYDGMMQKMLYTYMESETPYILVIDKDYVYFTANEMSGPAFVGTPEYKVYELSFTIE